VVLTRPRDVAELDHALTWAAGFDATPTASPRPQFGGVKFFMDGSLVARTAWMRAPYPNDDGGAVGAGFPAMAPDELTAIVRMARDRELHVGVHAIGDRALDAVLDAYADGSGPGVASDARLGVIHALVAPDDAIRRMQGLPVSIETQPALLTVLGAGYARALDRVRLRRLLPLRSMLDAHLAVSFGSDWPTCDPSPRLGMWAACARRSDALGGPDGVFEPQERITVKEALRAYTRTAAWALGMEDSIGSIEPGKLADLVIWDGDLLACPPDQLASLGIRTTIVGGEIVYDAAATDPAGPPPLEHA
jgi:predicted amidohydrolase YtcJ